MGLLSAASVHLQRGYWVSTPRATVSMMGCRAQTAQPPPANTPPDPKASGCAQHVVLSQDGVQAASPPRSGTMEGEGCPRISYKSSGGIYRPPSRGRNLPLHPHSQQGLPNLPLNRTVPGEILLSGKCRRSTKLGSAGSHIRHSVRPPAFRPSAAEARPP